MKTIKFILAVLVFCFKSIFVYAQTSACTLGGLPSIQFKVNCTTLSKVNMTALDAVGELLRNNPACKIKLAGYGASDKNAQQLSWDHVNAVKVYLNEKRGISETRIIFMYGMDGDGTTVDLIPTTEEGPNTVPAPHPNLRKIVNLKCN